MRLPRQRPLTRHVDRLHRAAWALCGSREGAEDLVRESFADVLARRRSVDADEQLYELIVALHDAFLTATGTGIGRPLAVPSEREGVALNVSSATRLSRGLAAGEVYATIAELPVELRVAVCAVDVAGLSYREASRALRISEVEVNATLLRARKLLAARLLGLGGPGREREGARAPSRPPPA